MRRRLGRIAKLFLAALIAWLGLTGLVTWRLVRRARPLFPEPAPNSAWQEVHLQTADGQEIGAWFSPGQLDHPIVLQLHGNGGSRSDDLELSEVLKDRGYGVLTLSLRAHGDSTGERNDFGYSARLDVVEGARWLLPHQRPILVLGRSLGSSAALYASEQLGTQVEGYFLESPFFSLRTAVRNRLRHRLPALVEPLAFAGMDLWGKALLPVDIVPGERAADIPSSVPVTIVTGEIDYRATVADAQAIRTRAPQTRVVVFPGADHLQLFEQNRSRYLDELERLRAASPGSYTASPPPSGR